MGLIIWLKHARRECFKRPLYGMKSILTVLHTGMKMSTTMMFVLDLSVVRKDSLLCLPYITSYADKYAPQTIRAMAVKESAINDCFYSIH